MGRSEVAFNALFWLAIDPAGERRPLRRRDRAHPRARHLRARRTDRAIRRGDLRPRGDPRACRSRRTGTSRGRGSRAARRPPALPGRRGRDSGGRRRPARRIPRRRPRKIDEARRRWQELGPPARRHPLPGRPGPAAAGGRIRTQPPACWTTPRPSTRSSARPPWPPGRARPSGPSRRPYNRAVTDGRPQDLDPHRVARELPDQRRARLRRDRLQGAAPQQAEEFEPGDEVVFYVTGVQAFGGLARVRSEMFEDRTPDLAPTKTSTAATKTAAESPEPYPWRVEAEPVLVLPEEEFVPGRGARHRARARPQVAARALAPRLPGPAANHRRGRRRPAPRAPRHRWRPWAPPPNKRPRA